MEEYEKIPVDERDRRVYLLQFKILQEENLRLSSEVERLGRKVEGLNALVDLEHSNTVHFRQNMIYFADECKKIKDSIFPRCMMAVTAAWLVAGLIVNWFTEL